jgi:hypothetical protein
VLRAVDNRREAAHMRIRLNDPGAAPDLVDALAAADCVAEPTEDGVVKVDVPWASAEGDERQAEIELCFFLRAWEAQRPGLVAVVTA